MTEPTNSRSLKRKISPDLQQRVEDILIKVPRTPGPPGDLDEEKKRWLIVGICLHSIISPLLRKYVDSEVSKLYNSLKSSDLIDKQRYPSYLKKYHAKNRYFLNYRSINNNNDNWKNNYPKYDYKVTSHVDLSKLFVHHSMVEYSKIDEECDVSALLGMIINISSFPTAVQTDAEKIRSDIRNSWAHCVFQEWSSLKYKDSFKSMEQLVKNLRRSSREEEKILEELDKWATNGQNLLSGLKLGIDTLEEIRQQTHVLSEYALTLQTVTESERINLQTELNNLKNDLQERWSNVETQCKENTKDIKKINKENEDPIPKNIRAQHRRDVTDWVQKDIKFIKTRATHYILDALPLHNCIVVTGSSGSGKSSNIHHAALHLRNNFGYEIIPVSYPKFNGLQDIMRYCCDNTKQVFVFDDFCGKTTIKKGELDRWRDSSNETEKKFPCKKVTSKTDITVSNMLCPKLLISCRRHIYNEPKCQDIALFTEKECNLSSPDFCLENDERIRMLKQYIIDDYIIAEVKPVIENMENFDFYPLLCELSQDKTSTGVKELLTDPLKCIKKEINDIIKENKYQRYALALCILFGGEFNTEWLDLRLAPANIKARLIDIVGELEIKLNNEEHRQLLEIGFSTTEGTYCKQRGTEYRMIHDKIHEMAIVICGQYLAKCFIKYMSAEFIQHCFIFKSLTALSVNDDSIEIVQKNEEDYFERLLCDLKENVITSTFRNSQLIDETFREKLINFFKRRDDAKAVLKKLDTDGCIITYGPVELVQLLVHMGDFTTPLMESVIRGYVDIVQFLIVDTKCDVNKTDKENTSPLYLASANGHFDVVELLIKHNADVSLCDTNGESPLYAACEGGHTNIVELLLREGAEVSKGNICGRPPLYVACEGGHKDIVELLLKYNADIFQIDDLEGSPFHGACEGGNKDIVELFLQKNADVSQSMEDGQSPLYIASRAGHTDIVELLLQKSAEVLQCDDFGNSPLHMACKGGHKNTVELLLRNKANISQCNKNKESPLYAACEGGCKDTVKLLLKKEANVFKCNANEETPLYVASKNGHTSTVELLLKNHAVVSKCDKHGKSPFNVAYEGGHTDTVELLLRYNADVNRCKNIKTF